MSQKRPNEDVEHDSTRRTSAPRPTRIRACVECKKHKIKCEPVTGQQKCAKCLRSGTECVPHNLDKRLQEEDMIWKANASAEIARLRSAVQNLLRHSGLPDLASFHEHEASPAIAFSPPNGASENGISTGLVVPPMDMTRDNSQEPDSTEESGLVTAPMRSLYDLTRIRTLRTNHRSNSRSNLLDADFIAQGLLPVEEAEVLFCRWKENLHQYLWGGLLVPYSTLDSVRQHSSLLTGAILTIAALHTNGRNNALEKCYSVFISLTYVTSLSKARSTDDIRALCLAAFYLSNLSWKLSGLAVRNAMEMNLHQSFQRLLRGRLDQRDNVRLWYALYICEHQFSIAYGRPSIIHEDAAVKNIEAFLDSPSTTPSDIRLCAQVSLLKTLTEAYTMYGSDPEQPLSEYDFQQLRMFNFAIEQWRLTWQSRSADCPEIGSYPSKGVVLYYHFARFQLNSLALRALPAPNVVSAETLSYDRREAANIAISAATSTLTLIFEEPDIRRALPGVPIFTHTMVAFCATFLLKMAKTWGSVAQAASPEWPTEPMGLGLNFNVAQVLSLSRRSANLLARVAEDLNDKHLTKHIVAGIRELLKFFESIGTPSSNMSQLIASANADAGIDQPSADLNGYNMYDLIGSYGFGFDETFLGQAASSDFDLWPV